MQTATVTISYDPATDKFSAENPVKVYPGVTQIEWFVVLTTPTIGSIIFGTEPKFPGIDFDKDWNGTRPKGDDKRWHVAIDDKLQPGDAPVLYHYTINTWYNDGDKLSPAVKKSWDPDVEEGGDQPPPP